MTSRRGGPGPRAARLVALAALCLSLVGLPACRVTVVTEVESRWDGSGDFVVRIGLDEQARTALTELGIGATVFGGTSAADVETTAGAEARPEPFADLEAAGWEVTSEEGAVTMRHAFEDPDQLAALSGQISGDAQPPLFPEMDLAVEAGLFRSRLDLHAVVAPTPELVVGLAGRGLAEPPTVEELERALGATVAESFVFVFSVSLPDPVAVTTEPADAPSAGPHAWEVQVGTRLQVDATSTARTPAFWVMVVAVAIAALAAAGIWLLDFLHRRRRVPAQVTRGRPSVRADRLAREAPSRGGASSGTSRRPQS